MIAQLYTANEGLREILEAETVWKTRNTPFSKHAGYRLRDESSVQILPAAHRRVGALLDELERLQAGEVVPRLQAAIVRIRSVLRMVIGATEDSAPQTLEEAYQAAFQREELYPMSLIGDLQQVRDMLLAAKREEIHLPGKPMAKRKGGRRPQSDPAADRRLYEAWKTGRYQTHEGLAREKGISETEVRRAIDRHRKRLARKA
ncbi:MAG: hypothetical protein JXA90_13555 [Planctomycetes bacterium]|nr:hypothetical protein [Planctomycetota bacterium]